jgi:hypothetical protein
MKTKILFLFFVPFGLYAQNLSEILEAFRHSERARSINETLLGEKARNSVTSAYSAPMIGAGLSHARSDSQEGTEHSFSLSQNILYPFSDASKARAQKDLDAAAQSEAAYTLSSLELDIGAQYHLACTAFEINEKAQMLYDEQAKRYDKLNQAYEVGEISKKELLMHKLDMVKFRQKTGLYKTKYLEELSFLQESSGVPITALSCDDLVMPAAFVGLKPLEEHTAIKALEYKKNSANALYTLEDSLFTSLNYELSYEKEIDLSRYKFAISLPLGFLTSQKESLKAEQLHRYSAYDAHKEYLQQNLKNSSASASLKIKTLYEQLELMQDEILPLNEELFELSKLSMDEGEGDVMEYLDAVRSYRLSLIDLSEIKQAYYRELFTLYKNNDMKFGDYYEKID